MRAELVGGPRDGYTHPLPPEIPGVIRIDAIDAELPLEPDFEFALAVDAKELPPQLYKIWPTRIAIYRLEMEPIGPGVNLCQADLPGRMKLNAQGNVVYIWAGWGSAV